MVKLTASRKEHDTNKSCSGLYEQSMNKCEIGYADTNL